MITMTWAAANAGRRDKILSPYPEEFLLPDKSKDFEGLKGVLNKMPSVDEMLLAASDERSRILISVFLCIQADCGTIFRELRKMLEAREPRLYRLLRWILSSNRYITEIECVP